MDKRKKEYAIAIVSFLVELVLRIGTFTNPQVSKSIKYGRLVALLCILVLFYVHVFRRKFNIEFSLHVLLFSIIAAEHAFILFFLSQPPRMRIPIINKLVPGTARQQNAIFSITFSVLAAGAYLYERRTSRMSVIQIGPPSVKNAANRT